MNFQNLTRIDKADFYIELAFKNSKRTQEDFVSKNVVLKHRNRTMYFKREFQNKVSSFNRTLVKVLQNIESSFPQVNDFAPFYLELCRVTIDIDMYKKSLGSLRWAWTKLNNLQQEFNSEIGQAKEFEEFTEAQKKFQGRAASVMKQISKNLELLDEYRKELKAFPTIKTGIFTISIAGFPNVGKSTLLSKITSAKPEIKDYPFTTKSIQLGYLKEDAIKIQFIDTPGALNRPLDKMNVIEKQAFLAFKHLSNAVVFIFDPTMHSGFSIEEQVELYKSLREKFNTSTWVIVVNKIDMKRVDMELKEIKDLPCDSYIEISAKDEKGLDLLKEKLIKIVKSHFVHKHLISGPNPWIE